jgi:hypothetical protein
MKDRSKRDFMGIRPIEAKITMQQLELRVDKSDQYQATMVDRTSTSTPIIPIGFGAIFHFPISAIRGFIIMPFDYNLFSRQRIF